MLKRLLPAAFIAALCAVSVAPADANDFPTRPVRLITPYAAGGGIDILTRSLAQGLSQAWNQQVIVDNRPGAGSTIGNAAVAKAAPDGYTLLISANAMAIGPVVYKSLPYDIRRDFIPISLVGTSPEVLTVNSASGVRSLADLQARARAGKTNYGSAGSGTLAHLAAESFNRRLGLGAQHISYKGSNPALIDLMAGQVDWLFDSPAAVLQQVQSGKLKALAVAAPGRTPQLPDVPTLAELGYPELDFLIWVGVMAPAGTPEAIVRRIESSLRAHLDATATRSAVAALGWDVAPLGQQAFAKFYETEIIKLGEAARNAGVKAD